MKASGRANPASYTTTSPPRWSRTAVATTRPRTASSRTASGGDPDTAGSFGERSFDRRREDDVAEDEKLASFCSETAGVSFFSVASTFFSPSAGKSRDGDGAIFLPPPYPRPSPIAASTRSLTAARSVRPDTTCIRSTPRSAPRPRPRSSASKNFGNASPAATASTSSSGPTSASPRAAYISRRSAPRGTSASTEAPYSRKTSLWRRMNAQGSPAPEPAPASASDGEPWALFAASPVHLLSASYRALRRSQLRISYAATALTNTSVRRSASLGGPASGCSLRAVRRNAVLISAGVALGATRSMSYAHEGSAGSALAPNPHRCVSALGALHGATCGRPKPPREAQTRLPMRTNI